MNNEIKFDNKLIIQKIRSALSKKSSSTDFDEENLPRAAVCAILKPDLQSGELALLIVKRTERPDDPWSGHMAFPGGRWVKKDKDIFATAIREVIEETGIDIRDCEVLGTLDDLIPSTLRSIIVTPFVALAGESHEASLNSDEIERFFWIPISFFMDERNATNSVISRSGVSLEVPSYRVSENNVIWGLTFRIIQDLVGRIKRKADQ